MTDLTMTSLHKIWSVSELNRQAKHCLETSLPLLWVAGEISNFTRAASGHWYFSLKDSQAQVRCVMFRGRNQYVAALPKEGDQIEARATVSLYEARGEFQLTLEFMQPAGLGRLYAAFEQLKQRLLTEGLFDVAHKKPLPPLPRAVGIVSSADAAALQDVLATLQRRQPGLRVILYPTQVQGKEAPAQIVQALAQASTRQEVDVLLICRGGGSIEDLWAFNDEGVARAIFACPMPTISGVGHETDITIADFVADQRAATPTAAAELACPDQQVLRAQWQQAQSRMRQAMQAQLQLQAQKLDRLSLRLVSPLTQLHMRQQQLQQSQQRLQLAMRTLLQQWHAGLLRQANSLSQLNPEQVLRRGYAIVQNQHGQTVTDSQTVSLQQRLHIRLANGTLGADVSAIDPD